MKVFTPDDRRTLRVVEGFRDRVLSNRPSATPKSEWTDGDYSAAADTLLGRSQKIASELTRWGADLNGARALELGCGHGIYSLLVSRQPVRRVVGIDLELPLFSRGEEGERTRRLTREILQRLDLGSSVVDALKRLPVHLVTMDATLMAFPDDSFDVLWSRSAMEHIRPIDKVLAEVARVVRPGGLIYHSIDPYFWVRGCHKTALVDIPWAHARLSLDEFRRFVTETEGELQATKRCRRLATLNQLSLAQWRETFEAGPFEILEWREDLSPFAETLLEEHPEVEESLLEGVERRDLLHGRIRVWLRNKGT
jgi:SAM-dependent methyltransferase